MAIEASKIAKLVIMSPCFLMVFQARWQRWFAIAFPWFCLPCPFVHLSFKRGY